MVMIWRAPNVQVKNFMFFGLLYSSEKVLKLFYFGVCVDLLDIFSRLITCEQIYDK